MIMNRPGPGLPRVDSSVPIASTARQRDGVSYVFAVTLRDGSTTGSFTLPDLGDSRVEVLGEDRSIDAPGGFWQGRFDGDQVHLYRISPADPRRP